MVFCDKCRDYYEGWDDFGNRCSVCGYKPAPKSSKASVDSISMTLILMREDAIDEYNQFTGFERVIDRSVPIDQRIERSRGKATHSQINRLKQYAERFGLMVGNIEEIRMGQVHLITEQWESMGLKW